MAESSGPATAVAIVAIVILVLVGLAVIWYLVQEAEQPTIELPEVETRLILDQKA